MTRSPVQVGSLGEGLGDALTGPGPHPSDGTSKAVSAPDGVSIPIAFTPGPWAWFGNEHGVYLATTHSGRRYVMGFERFGMHRAQPTFQVAGFMHPAAELVEFAVGDGIARGFKEGKADRSVYRYDISGIDHPDARLIAAAPELLEALSNTTAFLLIEAEAHRSRGDTEKAKICEGQAAANRSLIQRARGQ